MLSVLSIFSLAVAINLIEIFSTNVDNNNEENKKEGFDHVKALFIVISEFFFSVIMIFDKWVMTNKFFCPFKVCIYLGTVEFIYSLVGLIIVSFIHCQEDDERCKIEDSHGRNYFDNFFVFLDEVKSNPHKEIGLFLLYIFLMGIYNVFLVITVKYFTPTHSMITIVIGKFARYLNSYWSESTETQTTLEGVPAFITTWLYIIIFFLLNVYLEIFELNFCNLNYNTFYNINKRSNEESKSGMRTMRLLSVDLDDEQDECGDANDSKNEPRKKFSRGTSEDSNENWSNEYSSTTFYQKK